MVGFFGGIRVLGFGLSKFRISRKLRVLRFRAQGLGPRAVGFRGF